MDGLELTITQILNETYDRQALEGHAQAQTPGQTAEYEVSIGHTPDQMRAFGREWGDPESERTWDAIADAAGRP